jgi:HSP20 family protein
MPSVTYMNQSAPFWDFIASLEQQGPRHPFFAENRNHETETEREHEGPQDPQDPFNPWGWGTQFFGGSRGMPHRGGTPHGRRHNHADVPDEQKVEAGEMNNEKDAEMNNEKDEGEGPSGISGSDNENNAEGRPHGRGPHGRCGGGRRGRCGPGGPRGFGHRHGPGPRHGPEPHHGFGAHHGRPHHGHQHGGRRWGSWGCGGPFGGMGGGPSGGMGNGPFNFDNNNPSNANPFDPYNLVTHLWNQFTDTHPSNTNNNTATAPETGDHTPDADIFDTDSAYIIHVSLPGAKKEDVGVNWDAEKSELSVAGVIYRPGDEEFLKTLAMGERKVGAFERKIRLGTRASPASIDIDGISAKLEDGVLRVEVPKLDSGYVEIRKVDIE